MCLYNQVADVDIGFIYVILGRGIWGGGVVSELVVGLTFGEYATNAATPSISVTDTSKELV